MVLGSSSAPDCTMLNGLSLCRHSGVMCLVLGMGEPIKSSEDLWKAALLIISSLSSRVVAWLLSVSLSAEVVDDIHYFVYRRSVQYYSVSLICGILALFLISGAEAAIFWTFSTP